MTKKGFYLWGTPFLDQKPSNTPKQYFKDLSIKEYACGPYFTIILTDDGEVYVTGDLRWSDPNFKFKKNNDKPNLLHLKELSGKNVVSISCGHNFAAVLTKEGNVYTWGNGSSGQLGHSEEILKNFEKSIVPSPTLVKGLKDIKLIQCGFESMAAIGINGELLTWGKGEYGILGHGDEKNIFEPKSINSLSEEIVCQVKIGAGHMACLTENKEIFTWGDNYLGALGRLLEKSKEFDPNPKVIELLQLGKEVNIDNLIQADDIEFKDISCLELNTFALTNDGALFSCGKGGHEGGGHEDPHSLLCLIESLKDVRFEKIFSSHCNHIMCVTKKGEVYSWGDGSDGRLGSGENSKLTTPKKNEKLSNAKIFSMQCGFTHTAAILEISENIEKVDVPLKVEEKVEEKKPEKVEPKIEPKVEVKVEVKEEPKVEPKVEVKEEPKIEKVEPKVEVKEEPKEEFEDEVDEEDKKPVTEEPKSEKPKEEVKEDDLLAEINGSLETQTEKVEDKPKEEVVKKEEVKEVEKPKEEVKEEEKTKEEVKEVEKPKEEVKTEEVKTEEVKTEEVKEEKKEEEDENEDLLNKVVDEVIQEAIQDELKVDNKEEPKEEVENKPEGEKSTDKTEEELVEEINETKDESEPVDKKDEKKEIDYNKVSGYLKKKGDKGLVKSWKKRYFKIDNDVIGYYEKENGKLKGCINIIDIMDVLPGQAKHGFNVVTSKKRIYELAGFTQEDADKWTEVINSLVSKNVKKSMF